MNYSTYGTCAQSTSASRGAGQALKSVMQIAAIGFIFGTGSGAVSALPSERVNVYTKLPSTTVPERREVGDDLASRLVTAEQHLANIKSVIGLQMSELAVFFGVSRQSVHKWQSGTVVPGQENLEGIRELSRLADGLAAAKVKRPADLIRAKAFDGRSLLDLVKDGENYSEALASLVAESRVIDERYGATKLATSELPRSSDWQSSLSVPYANDV